MSIIKEHGLEINEKTGEVAENYFQKRMSVLGITAANNFISSSNPNVPGCDPQQFPLFEETEKGDIKINYFRLDGWFTNYKQGGEGWAKVFHRTRLKTPRVGDDGKEQKYSSPAKSGNFPYFPVQIIQKYKEQIEIPFLIITEGEFKAVVGCNNGLDVIATSGIHNFYDTYESKRIHHQIIELVKVCRVKRLMFLTDADTLAIKYAPDKDLAKRPNLFFSAIKNFREAIMFEMNNEENKLELTDVYYGHILTEFNEGPQKGLDDLLHHQLDKSQVREAISKIPFENRFFWGQNIVVNLNKIQEHFGLKSPENFYETYTTYIREKEFIYRNQTFVWSEELGKIEKIQHRDVDKYARIGCDWFKRILVPNKHKELEEFIVKWKVSEIIRDHVKKYPNFMEEIPKYDAWCNQPDMGETYKRDHNDCFNIFNPLKHTPKLGSFPTSLFFIKHLFGGEGKVTEENGVVTEENILGDPFTVALDYLTIMYQIPKQIIPVVCLVSPENGTGKSTFLKWMQDIYGSNATILDMSRFKMSFNSHYISKYLICLDEGFLDVEKKEEKERLKKLATDERQFLEFKGADVQEIDFYGKLIICSNDADSLMKIEEGEIRWFVNRVPSFASKGYKEDPFFRDKLRAEIPAFLHYLKHRTIFHPNEGRAWFKPEYIFTDQLRAIIENTRNYLDRVVDDFMEEMFLKYKLAEITLPLDVLVEWINRQNKYKLEKLQVKKYLKDKKKMSPEPEPKHIKYPTGLDDNGHINYYSGTDRYYIFKMSDWLKEEVVQSKENDNQTTTNKPNNEVSNIKDETPF